MTLLPCHAQDAEKVVKLEIEQADFIVDGEHLRSESEVVERLQSTVGLKAITLHVGRDIPYQRIAHMLVALQSAGLPMSLGLTGAAEPTD
jgi:hypothetical protein